jgi:integrase
MIPANRMKGHREHRVPLSEQAVSVLRALLAGRLENTHVFPGERRNGLSNTALLMLLRRMEKEGVTVHGCRSTFRDWAGDETTFAREIVEAALAHIVGDKAERAYRRSDALERQRALMAAWGAFCERLESAKVIGLGT